jgi:hypothetical protein
MVALASAGCGVSVEPIEVGAGCPQQSARPALDATSEPNLIDDFEHEGVQLPRRGGRDGMWVVASDGSSDELDARVSDRCAARGQQAGHFVGSGLSSWGAMWTALLRNQAGSTVVSYDATAYGGISFWAALSPEVSVPFSVPVGVTNPAPDVASSAVACPKCLDYYASKISLDHSWRRFELRFTDLVQLDNGNPTHTLRLDKLVGLTFWPDRDFDFWVDDVRFEP